MLVMDKLAKVKVHNSIDESQVMIQVLYLVHNVREMIIELKVKGLPVKYIGVISTQEAEISDSSVPLIIWQELCDQTEYSGYWENLMIASIFDFSFLCLRVIIGIIIAVIFHQMFVCTKNINHWDHGNRETIWNYWSTQ